MMNKFSIQKLQNVTVTNNGVIIKKGKVLRDSCVTEVCYEKYCSFKFRLKYFFTRFSFSNKTHILATDEWSKNYCHWLWEASTKLLLLKKQFPDAILVLPKAYLKINFMVKILTAFGFDRKNIVTIAGKSKLKVKNLAFIPCISIHDQGYYDFLQFHQVAKAVTSYYKNELEINFGERIYISRSDPKKDTARKVANEQELVTMLEKYGFKTVYMENFSFLEQVSISYHAKYVVAPHGAGITNLMFANEAKFLFELVNEKWDKTCFAIMCEKMKIPYYRLDCKKSNDRTVHLADILVDVKELEQNLIKNLK